MSSSISRFNGNNKPVKKNLAGNSIPQAFLLFIHCIILRRYDFQTFYPSAPSATLDARSATSFSCTSDGACS